MDRKFSRGWKFGVRDWGYVARDPWLVARDSGLKLGLGI